ncbi:hypothetical protein [Caulobacter mirabilis]|uniref:Spore coat protein U domain-containing protein n=1 Tax=Caulobacter mirabilis TaxID=69666 RepID=A0A2D2B0V1_9CAUL|nr:hypothetical protein [Caulobacter mirabilis]ATQ43878.1 hypothetical protein CSW64_16475 [Caulobacter mirabilis]
MIRVLLPLLLAAGLALAPGAALAQIQVTPATAPVLGTTIRGSSVTVFSISTTGVVTRLSGNGIRMSSASVTVPTISFNCGLLNLSGLCALRQLRVTIIPLAGSGPASIVKLRVGGLTGTTYVGGSPPPEGTSVTFDVNALGLLSTASFQLGMDVQLAANATPTGLQSFAYQVTVTML